MITSPALTQNSAESRLPCAPEVSSISVTYLSAQFKLAFCLALIVSLKGRLRLSRCIILQPVALHYSCTYPIVQWNMSWNEK